MILNLTNKENKLRILLGNREFIKLKTLKENFEIELIIEFVEKAKKLGYYHCNECDYYVREDLYDHSTGLCKSCLNRAIKINQEIEKIENKRRNEN